MNKCTWNRLLAVLMTAVLCLGLQAGLLADRQYFAGLTAEAIDVVYGNAIAYQQADSRWGSYPFVRRDPDNLNKLQDDDLNNSIAKAACSLLSCVNCVNYKTGVFINPTELADYAIKNGYRVWPQDGVVTTFFKAFCDNFGSRAGFSYKTSTTSASAALEYVRNGNTAVYNIPGHYIAVVDYNASYDMYLILDSAAGSQKRAPYILGHADTKCQRNGSAWTGVAWVKGPFLTSSDKYYLAFSAFIFSYSGASGGSVSSSGGTDGSIAPYPRPTVTLKNGSRGDDVKWLQYCLNKYFNLNAGAEDGIFGQNTENAVIAFQRKFSLDDDGMFGPASRSKMVEEIEKILNPPATTTTTTTTTTTLLQLLDFLLFKNRNIK